MENKIDIAQEIQAIADKNGLSLEKAQALLQEGVRKGKSIEHLEQLAVKTAELATETQAAVAKMVELNAQREDAVRYAEIEGEVLKKLKDSPDERLKHGLYTEAVASGYDSGYTSMAIWGSDTEKVLNAPILPTSERYAATKAARRAAQHLHSYVALHDGLSTPSHAPDGNMRIDVNTLKAGLRMLEANKEQYGAEAVEWVTKLVGTSTALDSATAGGIAEWVPTQLLSREIWEGIWLDTPIVNFFRRITMTGPTLTVPIHISDPKAFLMDQATVVADYLASAQANLTVNNRLLASNIESDNVKFDARKMGMLSFYSDEATDDAVVAVLDMLNERMRYGMAVSLESATLNGSRALNNLDNAGTDTNRLWANTADAGDGIRLATGLSDIRYAWNGIRRNVNANAKLTSSSFSRNELLSLFNLMGKYAYNQQNKLAYIMSINTWVKMLAFAEVSTFDKFSSGFTTQTGALSAINGVRVLITGEQATNLDDNGNFTNGTVVSGSAGVANKTAVHLVHSDGHAFGTYKQLRIESSRSVFTQQTGVVASARMDFKKMFKAAENTEASLINVAT